MYAKAIGIKILPTRSALLINFVCKVSAHYTALLCKLHTHIFELLKLVGITVCLAPFVNVTLKVQFVNVLYPFFFPHISSSGIHHHN